MSAQVSDSQTSAHNAFARSEASAPIASKLTSLYNRNGMASWRTGCIPIEGQGSVLDEGRDLKS